MEKWLVVIPARLHSTRLPEKPLQDLHGKPLIVRVFENLQPLEEMGADIIVATDAQKVMDACDQYKIRSVQTRSDHPSGTDRCHEVAKAFPKPYIMNVQGDEPFVAIDDLKQLAKKLENSSFGMGTLAYKSDSKTDFADPNVVKVAVGAAGQALYFSRAGIPFGSHSSTDEQNFWQHLGIYGFKSNALTKFCITKRGELEKRESLEQLRALENGFNILVVSASKPSIGIDTPQDLEAARGYFD